MAISSISELNNVAGSNTQIQYNNSGVFGASSNLTFDGSRLDVTGEVRASTGVLFGTDTAAANTLDDYEEGTWTPVWRYAGTSYTHTSQVGAYTKIGASVFFSCYMSISNANASNNSSAISVTGLPFTSRNTTNLYASPTIFLQAFNSSNAEAKFYIYVNGTQMDGSSNPNTGSNNSIMTSAMVYTAGGSNSLRLTGHYFV